MKTIRVILSYLKWHYTQGLADFFRNSLTIFLFLFHFFSIGLLAKTLFAPLKRLGAEKGEHFELKAYASGLIINTLMRIVGFICRIVVIVFGLIVLLGAVVLDIVLFLAWLVMPLLLVSFIGSGAKLLAVS